MCPEDQEEREAEEEVEEGEVCPEDLPQYRRLFPNMTVQKYGILEKVSSFPNILRAATRPTRGREEGGRKEGGGREEGRRSEGGRKEEGGREGEGRKKQNRGSREGREEGGSTHRGCELAASVQCWLNVQ